jgi:hypothetical protein
MITKKNKHSKLLKKNKFSKLNNKNFDGKICAPSNNEKNSYTCFSKKALLNIIDSWNKSYRNNKIKCDKSEPKLKLWDKIDNKLNSSCKSEYCWINQKFIDNKYRLKNKFFKPVMPTKWGKNINEWLNTRDIEKVMLQYKNKYPNFHFIGPVPMDFDSELGPGDCVINELCKIKIKKLIKNQKTKLGIIFNLDKHSEPGSHWVSLFADFDINKVYYFDSYGFNEPSEVTTLINRFKQQGKELNRNITSYTNNIRHQFKGSECGVYSMHFIIKLLENNKYEDIVKSIIKDDAMQKNRYKYYINKEQFDLN